MEGRSGFKVDTLDSELLLLTLHILKAIDLYMTGFLLYLCRVVHIDDVDVRHLLPSLTSSSGNILFSLFFMCFHPDVPAGQDPALRVSLLLSVVSLLLINLPKCNVILPTHASPMYPTSSLPPTIYKMGWQSKPFLRFFVRVSEIWKHLVKDSVNILGNMIMLQIPPPPPR